MFEEYHLVTIKAIIYDLDGVLVDAVEWHYHALNKALRSVSKFEILRDEHESRFNGLSTKKKLEILVNENRVEPVDVDKIWELKQELTVNVIEELACYDEQKCRLHLEIYDTLGIRPVCVTNSIRKTAELMLHKTGQLKFMDFIITNEDVVEPKPSPEGYNRALEKLQLKPEQVLIVEDSPKGLAAAHASGAHVLQVSNPDDVTFRRILDKIVDINRKR